MTTEKQETRGRGHTPTRSISTLLTLYDIIALYVKNNPESTANDVSAFLLSKNYTFGSDSVNLLIHGVWPGRKTGVAAWVTDPRIVKKRKEEPVPLKVFYIKNYEEGADPEVVKILEDYTKLVDEKVTEMESLMNKLLTEFKQGVRESI